MEFVVRAQAPAGESELCTVETDADDGSSAWHPAGYQTVGLLSSVALSVFAFFMMLMHRPAVPKKKPAADESSE